MPDCEVCGDPVAPTQANIRRYNQSGMRVCGPRCCGALVEPPKLNNVDRALDRRPSMAESLELTGWGNIPA